MCAYILVIHTAVRIRAIWCQSCQITCVTIRTSILSQVHIISSHIMVSDPDFKFICTSDVFAHKSPDYHADALHEMTICELWCNSDKMVCILSLYPILYWHWVIAVRMLTTFRRWFADLQNSTAWTPFFTPSKQRLIACITHGKLNLLIH